MAEPTPTASQPSAPAPALAPAMAPTTRAPRSGVERVLRGPVVVLLSVLLFVMANYIAARHYQRWDWTGGRVFTLSPRSREIARGLAAPVDLYVLLARDEPLYADVSELAERYASASSRVRVHTIDPDRQRERLIALAQRLNLQLVENRQAERTLSAAAIVAVRGTHHWEINREALRELGDPQGDSDEASASRVLNARITVERSISEALLQVGRDRATKLCFSAGHAEMPVAQGDRSGAGLAEDLRHHNFQVQEVEVHGQTGVSQDCDALVIAGAQRTWSPEDAAAVERYLRAGGNVAVFIDLVVLEGRVVPTGLEGVLALGGIESPAAITVEADREHLIAEVPPVHFRADNWNDHEITRDLRGTSIIAAMVRPLRRMAGATVVPAAIVQTTPQAWGETDVPDLLRTFTPTRGPGDVDGPVTIAMSAEIPGVTHPRPQDAAGRLVVVGTSEVVSGEYFSLAGRATVSNADMAEAIVGWLTSRRELVNIPARPVQRAALLVSEDGLNQVALYVIVLVPLAAALVGIAVWRARKGS